MVISVPAPVDVDAAAFQHDSPRLAVYANGRLPHRQARRLAISVETGASSLQSLYLAQALKRHAVAARAGKPSRFRESAAHKDRTASRASRPRLVRMWKN